MQDRFSRFVLLGLLLLAGAFVAEPYVARYFLAADEPRTIMARADLGAVERTAVELFQRASPSVVHVFVRPSGRELAPGGEGPGGDPRGGPGGGSGTGFVWDAAGHIVTNNHVVEGAGGRPVTIRLSNGDVVPATLVGTAPSYDLAVLRLGRTREAPPPLAVGSSADLKVGQTALAIGNPFGLDQTLTTGVISALKRRLPTSEGRELADVIQTDAAINPGNSGGPLLDSAGRLIGVNTAIYSPSGAYAGIGFAIPVDVVNRVVPQLIRDGRVPQPGIGIQAGEEAIAARLGIEGVVVVRTLPGSPAQRAGLDGVNLRTGEIGDIVVGVNGRPVRRLAELTTALESVPIGERVELTVERDGRSRRVQVEVTDVARAPG